MSTGDHVGFLIDDEDVTEYGSLIHSFRRGIKGILHGP